MKKTSLGILISALLLAPAIASEQKIGGYDFAYSSTGDSRALPVQVFDSGTDTYLQFRSGDAIPAIFSMSSSGMTLSVPRFEGPYVVVPNVHGHMLLQLGRSQAHVVYTGNVRRKDSPELNYVSASGLQTTYAGMMPAGGRLVASLAPSAMKVKATSGAAYDFDQNSYATPEKGDRVQWASHEATQDYSVPFVVGSSKPGKIAIKTVRSIAGTLQESYRIEIVGRDDQTHREGVAESRAASVADLLAAAGIPRDRLVIKTSAELKTSGEKGVVVGVSMRAFTDRKYEKRDLESAARVNLDSVLADLKAGRITPSQAKAQLQSATPSVAGNRTNLWEIRASDATVENMLKRWASSSGWRVVTQGMPQIAIHGDAELTRPDFLKAAEYVINQAKRSGYRISAKAYSNNVLVVKEGN